MKQILEITATGADVFIIKEFHIDDCSWINEKMPASIRANNNRLVYGVVTKKKRSDIREFLGDSLTTGFISYIYMLSDEELTQAILFLS